MLSALFFLALSFFALNCSVTQFSGSYRLYKNFDSVASKDVANLPEGDPIIGVLLVFTSDGAYNSRIKPIDQYTFCIYCLFDEHIINGDGMEFNYILYVPEDIRNIYQLGGGNYPKSGDPFWWYMSTYFGLMLPEIMDNWPKVIDLLCSSAELPRATIDDFINSGFYEPPWLFKTTEYKLFTIQETYNNPNCEVRNSEGYISDEDDSIFVFSYEIKTPTSLGMMIMNPGMETAYYNSRNLISIESEGQTFVKVVIKIPISLLVPYNGVVTWLYGVRVQHHTSIHLKSKISQFPKKTIPETIYIYNVEDRDDRFVIVDS